MPDLTLVNSSVWRVLWADGAPVGGAQARLPEIEALQAQITASHEELTDLDFRAAEERAAAQAAAAAAAVRTPPPWLSLADLLNE